MSRVKGNVTPLLSFQVGAGSTLDFGDDVVSWEFADGEGGAVTMSDFENGVSPVQLNVTFVLDFAADASYEYIWANAGTSGVTYTVRRNAGTAVGQDNPNFTGTLTMPPKPRFAVEAGDATTDTTYDVSFAVDTWNKEIA